MFGFAVCLLVVHRGLVLHFFCGLLVMAGLLVFSEGFLRFIRSFSAVALVNT